LIDTYDTIHGAQNASMVGRELAREGKVLRGVRIDSGDLLALSREVRKVLDDAGLQQTIIFASGNLDEYELARLLESRAPIDGFGVGTRMGVSSDAPYLEIAYKLVAYDGRPTLKLSSGKESWPGAKQVWRTESSREYASDWLGLTDEPGPAGATPLLVEVMSGGRRTGPPESLAEIRTRCAAALASLPPGVCRLNAPERYPVQVTDALRALEQEARRQLSVPYIPG